MDPYPPAEDVEEITLNEKRKELIIQMINKVIQLEATPLNNYIKGELLKKNHFLRKICDGKDDPKIMNLLQFWGDAAAMIDVWEDAHT